MQIRDHYERFFRSSNENSVADAGWAPERPPRRLHPPAGDRTVPDRGVSVITRPMEAAVPWPLRAAEGLRYRGFVPTSERHSGLQQP